MAHVLYEIHGSHPCVAVERALQLKRQPYRLRELPPAFHVPLQWLRFRTLTVPVLVLGSGETLVGSTTILHRLDELVPEPPLLPADPAARGRVVEAERWGDEVLQPAVRRLTWLGIKRSPQALKGYAKGSKLPVPGAVQTPTARLVSRLAGWRNRADARTLEADSAAIPGWLDHVDALIADGVIGGPQPNAADLQISSSVRLLGTFADARPQLAGRPAWELARRAFPTYPGAGSMPPGTYPIAAPAPAPAPA
jgi:glutathione S-transferase